MGKVNPWAFPRHWEHSPSNLAGNNQLVPFSSPEDVIPRIECPVSGMRMPQEPLRAKNLGIRIQVLKRSSLDITQRFTST